MRGTFSTLLSIIPSDLTEIKMNYFFKNTNAHRRNLEREYGGTALFSGPYWTQSMAERKGERARSFADLPL